MREAGCGWLGEGAGVVYPLVDREAVEASAEGRSKSSQRTRRNLESCKAASGATHLGRRGGGGGVGVGGGVSDLRLWTIQSERGGENGNEAEAEGGGWG